MVGSTPTDGLLRPVHELWGFSSYDIHLSGLLATAVPVIGHTGVDDVGSLLFWVLVLNGGNWPGRLLRRRRRRRLASRRRRQQSFALGDLCEPVTLPSDVVGRLRTAMELAGGIKGLLKGESR